MQRYETTYGSSGAVTVAIEATRDRDMSNFACREGGKEGKTEGGREGKTEGRREGGREGGRGLKVV